MLRSPSTEMTTVITESTARMSPMDKDRPGRRGGGSSGNDHGALIGVGRGSGDGGGGGGSSDRPSGVSVPNRSHASMSDGGCVMPPTLRARVLSWSSGESS